MLILHRSSRGDLLVERLARLLAAVPTDPFSREVVAVPTRGVERWLTQQLSSVLGASPGRSDGVCANVDFPFPATLVGEVVATVSEIDPDRDPWLPDRVVWPLLDVVDRCAGEPWMASLAAHVGHRPHDGAGADDPDEAKRSRRWSAVRHLADLFDRYGVSRPALVRSWAAGLDLDGAGRPLAADLAWQAMLWRQLRQELGVPSPAERLEPACARLRKEPSLVDIPERLSLFGLTRLSASHLEVLGALSAHRDVHLWLLHPSEAQWSAISRQSPALSVGPRPRQADSERADGERADGERADGERADGERAGHPLLTAWGRDAREMQVVLSAADVDLSDDDAVPLAWHPPSLLGHLQAQIRTNQAPSSLAGRGGGAEGQPLLLDPADRSLQVHACHGRGRQVEVLREVILGLLEDDPTLEPRDIIVMCPDIDTFAPLIGAAFGPGQEVAGRDLHVRLADRSLRQTNPVLTAVAQLLDLASGRLSASVVTDFVAAAPVRRRFDFDDDDLSRMEVWVRTSGVRWGLDPAGRLPYKLGSVAAGTWAAGLDRLLLGVAMSEDDLHLFGGVLPLDDVGSGDVDRAGRLAELVDRLGVVVDQFRGTHTLDEWLTAISEAADNLTAVSTADEWQRNELGSLLSAAAADAEAGGGGGAARLSLTEVRALLTERLRGRPTRANFRTGHLTMCTLVPMRSVPHRVICLLGLDDGVFPRHRSIDGDDLLESDSWVGDRDPRSEDRQLLLDALLAAKDHLVITYAGRNERTNAFRPPAVPVGELLDVLDATVVSPDGQPPRCHLVIDHPLQAWDERNFAPGGLVGDRPWSFDRVALAGALAAAEARTAAAAPMPAEAGTAAAAPMPAEVRTAGPAGRKLNGAGPGLAGVVLPRDRQDPVELGDLVRFVQHPVKAFLQQRLGLRLPDEGGDPADGLPVELDGLERWRIGDRLLSVRSRGADPGASRAAELARGDLPPLRLGEEILDPLLEEVDSLMSMAGWEGTALDAVDLTLDLGGRSVVGTVADLCGDQLCVLTYSALAPKHRLAAWVRILALSASHPDRPWRARMVGRGSPRGTLAVRTIGPLGVDETSRLGVSRQHLEALVDLYDRGRAEPLPLFCKTSAAWAAAASKGKRPFGPARSRWVTEANAAFDSEDRDLAHRLVFDGPRSFEQLLVAVPRPDESGEGWALDEASRLGRLARRLWDPLLAEESD